MRKDAEILLRSTIADTAAYLKMLLTHSTAQVEIMRALALAMRVADAIAASYSGDLSDDEVAELRTVAGRLKAAVSGLRAGDLRSWIEEAADEISAFCGSIRRVDEPDTSGRSDDAHQLCTWRSARQ